MVESGEYELSCDYETIQEIREFLAGITCPMIFDCGQESNLFRFRMRVPEGLEVDCVLALARVHVLRTLGDDEQGTEECSRSVESACLVAKRR